MDYALWALFSASFIASVFLIFIYNYSINLDYKIYSAEETIKKLESEKAQLQDKVFALLSDASLKKLSANNGLVEEKNPKYLKISAGTSKDLITLQTR